MGKKGKKTRWRRLPIGGGEEEGGLSLEAPPPTTDAHRITFNEDEYTKITTPRQDVLFKKGYLGRKRPPNPSPIDNQEIQSASADSVESESYVSEEAQYFTPNPPGYMDPNGVYYVNSNMYETYDPYTGTVTVVVGPSAQYPGAPVLAALPCHPVPLQPVEWFNPPQPAPWCSSYNRKKRYSTDSQNCSAQSSESTGPPGSPQEPVDEGACAMYPPQYVYPGYMFGPPIYNMNGMTVQGMIPQPVPLPVDPSANKRRKKRRRRRRGGVTDDGSESSCCEEVLQCDVTGCQSEMSSDATCHSGASSDAGVANSDSGINTDPTPNSGSNSPPLPLTIAQATESVETTLLPSPVLQPVSCDSQCNEGNQSYIYCDSHQSEVLVLSPTKEEVPELLSEEVDGSAINVLTRVIDERSQDEVDELSTGEDDITPNLCANAPEFSSQESTLSCLSTPSATKELIPNENAFSILVTSQELVNCQTISDAVADLKIDDIAEPTDDETTLQNCIPAESDVVINDLNVSEEEIKETSLSIADFSIEEEIERLDIVCLSNEKVVEKFNEKSEIKQIPEVQTPILNIQPAQNEELTVLTILPCTKIEQISDQQEVVDLQITNVKPESEPIPKSYANLESSSTTETDQICSRFPPCPDTIAPVPPPRRKRSMCRAADKLASKIVEDAIREGIEEAANIQTSGPLTITEAVTRWLHSQGSSPLTCPLSDSEEEQEEQEISTGPKNVYGNPFPASYRSERVAKDSESVDSTMSAGEWDLWDSRTRDMCDPARSVDKYYRLGADVETGDLHPSIYKTAMHIRHSGPFPCGVCCIIQ